MPDHKEMGRKRTSREHEPPAAPPAPERQADGDPGNKKPRIDHGNDSENEAAGENEEDENAGVGGVGCDGAMGRWGDGASERLGVRGTYASARVVQILT